MSTDTKTTIVIKSELLRDACTKVIGVIPPVSFRTPQVEVSLIVDMIKAQLRDWLLGGTPYPAHLFPRTKRLFGII